MLNINRKYLRENRRSCILGGQIKTAAPVGPRYRRVFSPEFPEGIFGQKHFLPDFSDVFSSKSRCVKFNSPDVFSRVHAVRVGTGNCGRDGTGTGNRVIFRSRPRNPDPYRRQCLFPTSTIPLLRRPDYQVFLFPLCTVCPVPTIPIPTVCPVPTIPIPIICLAPTNTIPLRPAQLFPSRSWRTVYPIPHLTPRIGADTSIPPAGFNHFPIL